MSQITRITPGPGQESVWDYPRPPRVERTARHIQVVLNRVVIAESRAALRVLETSHPPVYYLPPHDVRLAEYFRLTARTSYCEFKGAARYYTITVGDRAELDAAWFYPDPAPGYELLRDYVAVYPSRMDACLVDGQPVQPQPSDFYGGWITPDIVGPFKGAPGTSGW